MFLFSADQFQRHLQPVKAGQFNPAKDSMCNLPSTLISSSRLLVSSFAGGFMLKSFFLIHYCVGERIKELRTAKKLPQSELAEKVGLTYIQIGRYETQKSAPSSDILHKLTQALNATTDLLMMGSQNEMVSVQLADKELLKQFREVELLSSEDKHLVKTFIDTFITKKTYSATR